MSENSSNSEGPPKYWYKAMDKIASQKYIPAVEADIEENPSIKEEVSDFRESFIEFAAIDRLHFEPDIEEELRAYYNRKRMYHYNVKKWYRIINKVFERDDYTCQYCGQVGGKLEADHIVPFSKGGGNNIENLNTACRTCNRQKRDKTVEEFMKWKEER